MRGRPSGDSSSRPASPSSRAIPAGAAIPDTHPLCFQSSLAIRPGAAFFTLASADLVLFLGSRLSLFYVFGDIFRKDAKFIQADIEAEEIGRNRSVDLGVAGDVRALLEELNRVIDARGIGGTLRGRFHGWVETVRKADADGKAPTQALWESAAVPIHPLRLAREVDAFMDRDDDIVVADGGDTQVWMGMTRTVRKGGQLHGSGALRMPRRGTPLRQCGEAPSSQKAGSS